MSTVSGVFFVVVVVFVTDYLKVIGYAHNYNILQDGGGGVRA